MIYYKLDKTSRYYDPLFPKKNKIGLRSIRFLESELNLWMQTVAAKGENHE
ncbi:MAG: AlpA family phage regulatory protein [Burkholderiales bacterium]|nr:AlpA family phage regulatory protein [Burkholderiales bacterium]